MNAERHFDREDGADGRVRAVCRACPWRGPWQGQPLHGRPDAAARRNQHLATLGRTVLDYNEHTCDPCGVELDPFGRAGLRPCNLRAHHTGGHKHAAMGGCDACDRSVPVWKLSTLMTSGGEGSFCPTCRGVAPDDEEEDDDA